MDIDYQHVDIVEIFIQRTETELNNLLDELDIFINGMIVTSPYGVLVLHARCTYSRRCIACTYVKIPETFPGTSFQIPKGEYKFTENVKM